MLGRAQTKLQQPGSKEVGSKVPWASQDQPSGGNQSGARLEQRKEVIGQETGTAVWGIHTFLPDATVLSQPSSRRRGLLRRCVYPVLFVPLSAPASKRLNVSSRTEGPLQEMEFDSQFGCPLLSILPCICISGNMVTHPPLGQKAPLVPVMFRRSHLVPPSTPKSDSSHSGNGCRDLPGLRGLEC